MLGGLYLIRIRAALDVVTIATLISALVLPSFLEKVVVLLSAALLTLATAGHTARWTILFPIFPIVVLQCVQYSLQLYQENLGKSKTLQWIINIPSILCVFMAAALTIMFPAVELPPIDKAVYGVGVKDFYIPMEITQDDGTKVKRDLPSRLLYPTDKKHAGEIPYLSEEYSDELCFSTMKFGGPPPLRNLSWMLHPWKLAKLRATRDAPLAPNVQNLPLVAYSHGLGGTLDIHMYQPMSLTARLGACVVVVTHMDGSAACVPLSSGEVVVREHIPDQGAVYTRRKQTAIRVQELVGAVDHVLQGKASDKSPFHKVASPKALFMGHSFGATTALAAAHHRPDLSIGVVAHEPVVDWIPDDARNSLLSKDRVAGLSTKIETTPSKCSATNSAEKGSNSIHDNPILVMNSQEWIEKEWGLAVLLREMAEKKQLGLHQSRHITVSETKHVEFSDMGMLTANWLFQAIGMVGPRPPPETAEEISLHTIDFIRAVHAGSK